jgi:hypothetical protein
MPKNACIVNYEYKVKAYGWSELEKGLKRMNKRGWEFVSFTIDSSDNNARIAVFRRKYHCI